MPFPSPSSPMAVACLSMRSCATNWPLGSKAAPRRWRWSNGWQSEKRIALALVGTAPDRLACEEEAMKKQRLPKGWTEERIRKLAQYYDNMTEDEQAAEIEAALKHESETLMT